MADTTHDELLSRLAGQSGSDAWAALAASQPQHAAVETDAKGSEEDKVDALVERIRELSKLPSAADAAATPIDDAPRPDAPRARVANAAEQAIGDAFVPHEPASFDEAQITSSAVEGLVLKMMLARGDVTGRQVHEHIKLPFRLVDVLLRELKADQLVVHKGSAPMNDYLYQLTDMGRERARRLTAHCTYFGAAPVALDDYISAVASQSLTTATSHGRGPAAGLFRPVDQPTYAQAARPGNQLGPRLVPLRTAGKRQDEHCRTRDEGLRTIHLDSPRHRRRRRDHPSVRPQRPRSWRRYAGHNGLAGQNTRSTSAGSASAGRPSSSVVN